MSAIDEPPNPTADVVMDSTEAPSAHLSDEDDAGGLFGSGSEDERGRRKLDDEELDSGDDEDRNDRMEEDGMDSHDDQDKTMIESQTNVLDLSLGRHGIPQGDDGELYLLKHPHNLGIEPKAFALKQFQPPSTDHHSMAPPSATFSPSETANSTIRWKYGAKNPQLLQSNARVLRWSDGSMTIQLASKPTEQYELVAKPLAPPQHNPHKPTPTSTAKSRDGAIPYSAQLDSHTYLASPQEQSSFVRVTNHITTSLSVKPSVTQDDDALIRLQDSLAAAKKVNKATTNGGVGIIDTLEDPELAKKKAEVAEREKIRAQRRRQNQEERDRDRANRVLGRSGMRTGGVGGGLTLGSLEDEEGPGASRARAGKPSRKQRRRNSEYSEDEEDYRNRGRTKEDEYDEDDGFLVGSDEDPEVGQDDSEEEEMESGNDKETQDGLKKGKAKGTSSGGRLKRRNVVEDEDED